MAIKVLGENAYPQLLSIATTIPLRTYLESNAIMMCEYGIKLESSNSLRIDVYTRHAPALLFKISSVRSDRNKKLTRIIYIT